MHHAVYFNILILLIISGFGCKGDMMNYRNFDHLIYCEEIDKYEFNLGLSGIRIYNVKEIEPAQNEYAKFSQGNLNGTEDGDWRENWLLIGYNTLLGDPIFIDLNKPDHPVFTAAHGTGEWDPSLINDSLSDFSKTINLLTRLEEEATSFLLEENYQKAIDVADEYAKQLIKINAKIDPYFWTDMIERYQEWIEDNMI